VKWTAKDFEGFDQGKMPAIEGSRVAAKYWELYTARKELRTTIQ